MGSVVAFSLRLRGLFVTIAILLAAVSIWEFSGTSVDIVPEFSPVSLEVKTEALGLSPAEVESLITIPLEADLLNGVPWLQSIESESISGLSSIEMFFTPGTNLMQARQMVQERLTQARALPNVSSPPTMLQPVSSASRIANIGLTSKTVSLIDMSVLARWEIVPQLMGVPGVANVAIWGQRDRQLQVRVNPTRLHANGISLEQIVKTAGEAVWESPLTYLESSTPGTGGFVDTPNQRLSVRHLQPILTPAEFARIPISGSALALGSVADVVQDHQPLIGDAIFKDGPGLMLVVEKFPGFNTLEVTRGVETALAKLKPAMAGIEVNTSTYRPASFIERATGNLWNAFLIAAALIAAALLLTLRSVRSAVVAVAAITLSLLVAGLVLHVFGAAINMMVAAGFLMAIGVIVSDAVIGTGHIAQRLQRPEVNSAYLTKRTIIIQSVVGTRRPLYYAAAILAIAALPALFVGGSLSGFLRPLIWSYIIALFTSFLVALTVTPALCALLMPLSVFAASDGSTEQASRGRWTERLVQPAVCRPVIAYAIVGLGAAICIAVWPRLERTTLPDFNETDLVVELQGITGTSLQAMERIASGLIRDVRAIPGVHDAAAHIGRAALSREVADVDSAELSVSMDPSADYEATMSAIEAVVRSHPGVSSNVQAYMSSKMREALTGDDKLLTVRVYGQDPDILASKADEIRALLAGIDGVKDPKVESQTLSPTIQIEVVLDKAARYGLKPGDVRRATSVLTSGITVGALFQDQKVFEVVVWGAPEIRDNLSKLQDLLIDTGSGAQVRLADVAAVRVAPALNVIRRQGVSRRIDVEASIVGRSVTDVRRDVAQRIAGMPFPFEYHAELLGQPESEGATIIGIGGYLAAAAMMIFLLLQAALKSWRLAAASIVVVPVIGAGALVAIALTDGMLSLASLVGFFAILAIAIQHGLALVMHFEWLEQLGSERTRLTLVLDGLRDRTRPFMASSVATGAFFLPLALLKDAAGLELAYPAAVAAIGSLVATVLVTLIVVPGLYLKFGAGAAAWATEEGAALDGVPAGA